MHREEASGDGWGFIILSLESVEIAKDYGHFYSTLHETHINYKELYAVYLALYKGFHFLFSIHTSMPCGMTPFGCQYPWPDSIFSKMAFCMPTPHGLKSRNFLTGLRKRALWFASFFPCSLCRLGGASSCAWWLRR